MGIWGQKCAFIIMKFYLVIIKCPYFFDIINRKRDRSLWKSFSSSTVLLPTGRARYITYRGFQKFWTARFYGQTVSNIENLRARYVLHFSILPTGAPFQLKIPKYLSSRIFLNFRGPPRNAGKVKNTIFLNFYFSASEHCRVIKRHLPGL